MTRSNGGRGLRVLLSGTDWAAKGALVVMAGFVTVEVLSRGLFGVSTQMAEEVASLALIVLLFLGLPGAFADGSLLRVQAVFDHLPPAALRFVEIAFRTAALAITLVYVWQVGGLVLSSYRKSIVTDTALATPIYLPQGAMLLGLVALAAMILVSLARAVMGTEAPARVARNCGEHTDGL